MADQKELHSKTFIISAGHSSSRPGASAGILKEHELTADYAARLQRELEYRGAHVIMVDQSLPLYKRIEFVKGLSLKDALAIEIHFNAFNGQAEGTEAFYKLGDTLALTNMSACLVALNETLGIRNRGVKLQGSSARGKLGWLNIPNGVILEVAFMDNPSDMSKVPVDHWAEVIAQVLVP